MENVEQSFTVLIDEWCNWIACTNLLSPYLEAGNGNMTESKRYGFESRLINFINLRN